MEGSALYQEGHNPVYDKNPSTFFLADVKQPPRSDGSNMSSIRHSVPSRSYRERAQPLSRERRHGMLEKHKDYSLRAKDHNEKKARLRILRQKAADRNPDEFYYGMLSSKTVNGIKVADRGNKALSQEVVQLLKTQDAGYLRTLLQMTRREKAKLEQAVFTEETQDVDGVSRQHIATLKDIDGTSTDRQRIRFVENDMETEEQGNLQSVGDESASIETDEKRGKAQQRDKLRKRLEALRQREQQLAIAEQELEKQRAKMNGTAGGVNKNGVKFKVRERRR